MKVYVALINDRHSDPEPYVFSTAEAAIEYASGQARQFAFAPHDIEERPMPGWLYYARYSVEGDSVRVQEKEVDQP